MTSLDLRRYGRSVFIFGSLDYPEPVIFHRNGGTREERDVEPDENGEVEHRRFHTTRCGRILWWNRRLQRGDTWVDGSYKHGGNPTRVHIEHARRFARPCRQCWPETP